MNKDTPQTKNKLGWTKGQTIYRVSMLCVAAVSIIGILVLKLM